MTPRRYGPLAYVAIHRRPPDKRRPYHEREIPGPAGENNLWDGACSTGWTQTAGTLSGL